MRLTAIVAVFMLLLPMVSAVSILLPTEISDGEDIQVYYNDTESVVFKVRGDAATKNVTFYVQSTDPAVTILGQQNFTTTFQLSNYQEKSIRVDLQGKLKLKNVEVKYGTRASGSSGQSIGFDEVTESSFNVDVVCRSSSNCPGSSSGNLNVTVPAPPSNNPSQQSSGGGGGGAGGVAGGPVRNADSTGGLTDPVAPEPRLQDLTAGETSLSEARVNTNQPQPIVPAFANDVANAAGAVVEGGRQVAIVLLGLLLVTFVMSLSVYNIVKKGVDI